MQIHRAISIRQPFVELILRGSKREEYRSQPTRIRERVYLYASLQPFDAAEEWAKVDCAPGALPVGLILGSVEIVDCRLDPVEGCYAYVLRNPVRLAHPLKPLNQPQPVFWRPVFMEAELAAWKQEKADGHGATAVRKQTASRKSRRAPEPPLQADPALAAIVGSDPLPREELVTRLWTYIETHKLQDAEEKRFVHTDANLHRLLGKSRVSLYELAAMVSKHVT